MSEPKSPFPPGWENKQKRMQEWSMLNCQVVGAEINSEELINTLIAERDSARRELEQKFPDIGKDPCKIDGFEESKAYRDIEQVKKRLNSGVNLQQKGVPDQTALVWRKDLDDLMMHLIITNNRARLYSETLAELEQLKKDKERLEQALGLGTAWPVTDVLHELANWCDHLAEVHNCDCHGHEERLAAVKAAKRLATEALENEKA